MSRTVRRQEGVHDRCLVGDCQGQRLADQIFCRPHWFQLSVSLRNEIWDAYFKRDRDRSVRLIRQALEQLNAEETAT